MLGAEGALFPGNAGVVKDGILPAFYGYEAGQPATGLRSPPIGTPSP